MKSTFYEALKLVEQLGGKLSDVKKDSSGSNIYIFTVDGSDITVHSRCLQAFYEALKTLIKN
jgi:hypothetical protein